MATVTKGLIGTEDIHWFNGGEATFTRPSSSGRQLVVSKMPIALLSSFEDFADAVSRIGTAETRLVLDTDSDVASTVTVPTTLSIEVIQGSVLATTGGTITINGPFEAGPYQVFSGSGTITFGTDIYARPEWWGAVADGSTDDRDAINYAFSSSGSVMFRGGLTYNIESAITVTSSDIRVMSDNGQRFTIAPQGAYTAVTFQGAATAVSTTVSGDTSMNQPEVAVTSATNMAAGQLMLLDSDDDWYYDLRTGQTKGELHRINKVDGTTITVEALLFDSYDVSEETVTVTTYNPIEVVLEDMNISYPANTLIGGLAIKMAENVRIRNCDVTNSATTGYSIQLCYDVIITECTANGINRVSFGYGVQFTQCTHMIVDKSNFVACRRGVDFSGNNPSRVGLVQGCYASAVGLDSGGSDALYDDSSGFGTHGTAEFIRFKNNITEYVRVGILSRGANIDIDGNIFIGPMKRCISVTDGEKMRITNNRAERNALSRTPAYKTANELRLQAAEQFVQFFADVEADGEMLIRGNTGTFLNEFIELQTNDYSNLVVRDNAVFLDNNNAGNDIMFIMGDEISAGEVKISGNSDIRNNSVTLGQGTWTYIGDTGDAEVVIDEGSIHIDFDPTIKA